MVPAHNNAKGNFTEYEVAPSQKLEFLRGKLEYTSQVAPLKLKNRSQRETHSSGKPDGRHYGENEYYRLVKRNRSISDYTSEYTSGPWLIRQQGDLRGLYGEPVSFGDWDPTVNNMWTRAQTEAMGKLRGEDQLQLANDALELGKSLKMIADPSIRVLSALNAARRGRWSTIPHHLGMNPRDVLNGKYPANKWLEYQYGWKPLLGSIHSGYDRLKASPRTGAMQVRRVIRQSLRIDRDSGDVRVTCDVDLMVKCIIKFRVANPILDTLDGLGLINPLAIAWEAVPFSFVVDWFMPVGNVLSAATSTLGLKPIATITTKRVFAPVKVRHRWAARPGAATFDLFETYRSVKPGGFPTPGLYTVDSPFSTSHVVSALSLLRQLL
uniref:Maturation protein n=1 Tax=Erysiphales associated levi-like virus 1 TaxID=2754851 RepID=A0A7D6IPV5_9VIRU|nr:hypothetical protein [Erysiphales associated levi-like virus 1]